MEATPDASQPPPLTPAEQQLLREIGRGEPPLLRLRTATTVDVGQWFRSGRVCVGVWPDRVALFASGRRPYREVVARSELRGSLYNFLTGELALATAATAVRRLKLAPREAYQVLSHINRKESVHA